MLRPREFTDTRPSLLAALGGGGDGAWHEFFGLYAPAVYRVARLRGLAGQDAEDIVQQTMVSILGHIEGFEYSRDRGRFRSWVRRIAENKIADHFRARGARGRAIESAGDAPERREETDDSAWCNEWARQDLRHCLDQVAADVSPRRMEAFRLFVVKSATAAETAEILGMTIGAVYIARSVVMNELRRRMESLEAAGDRPPHGGRESSP